MKLTYQFFRIFRERTKCKNEAKWSRNKFFLRKMRNFRETIFPFRWKPFFKLDRRRRLITILTLCPRISSSFVFTHKNVKSKFKELFLQTSFFLFSKHCKSLRIHFVSLNYFLLVHYAVFKTFKIFNILYFPKI